MRQIQTSLWLERGLSWGYLTALDLKTSCRALSASVRWNKTICRVRAYLNQWGIVMRVTWTSVFSNMAEIEAQTQLVARKNRLVCGKLMHVPTNFNPIWPRQKICISTIKKSASVLQPLAVWGRHERVPKTRVSHSIPLWNYTFFSNDSLNFNFSFISTKPFLKQPYLELC